MSGLRAKRKNISQTLHSLELRQKVNDAKAKLAVPKILPHFHANTEEDHIGDLREQLLEFRERRQEGVGKFGRNLRRGNYRPELENGRYRSEA